MEALKLFYSIIQFSPFPDRFEYVNAGVAVFDVGNGEISFKIADDLSRVKKFFGEINATFLKRALHDFSERVKHHFARTGVSVSSVDNFNSKRADLFRLTPLNSVAGDRPAVIADKLFRDLVAWDVHPRKIERINTLLTSAFREAGVLQLLDKRPEPVHIEQYGVSIQADYGYQNGVYNLIDSARFDTPSRGLAEAGKRVLEGKALREHLAKRLIVVAEFGSQSDSFAENLREDFERVGAKLFRMDEVDELAEEIRRTAHN
ncbi:hypothetical protein RRU01S_11_00250 [Agrobacterium rubi TR3 = NBRC 13261]|uniref:DUF3037 domain-containing protein n=1 Tax=Agrobacterium rubi TR3 = NBRC 13261 TaxID=1368415 RepID=A0A081CUM6_9HYPH|nr:DUF3037 domain-containing protein [Agrobacterium rubi]MBP1879225.1 hypothetical protein [Agrobacterium rubi]MCL6652523.1 hypothetical protein [Agrobacterium rubi]GAK70372.1 hypothetical protein RRU01S_11_00250 [Agrobacterium rubi TR3 = NBRC 13261]